MKLEIPTKDEDQVSVDATGHQEGSKLVCRSPSDSHLVNNDHQYTQSPCRAPIEMTAERKRDSPKERAYEHKNFIPQLTNPSEKSMLQAHDEDKDCKSDSV